MRAACPDVVPTWDHFKPTNLVNNAVLSAVTAGVIIASGVVTKQMEALKAAHEPDEEEAERISKEADAAVVDAKARAPGELAVAVLRDIAIKSTQRSIEFSLFFLSSVPTHALRDLTTNLSKELSRIDGKAEKPGVLRVVFTALVSSSIGRLSVVAIDTFVDVYRSLVAKKSPSGGALSKEERAVERSRVFASLQKRVLLSTGTGLLTATLVGLGYVVATATNVSSSKVCGIAGLVGENLLAIVLLG